MSSGCLHVARCGTVGVAADECARFLPSATRGCDRIGLGGRAAACVMSPSGPLHIAGFSKPGLRGLPSYPSFLFVRRIGVQGKNPGAAAALAAGRFQVTRPRRSLGGR